MEGSVNEKSGIRNHEIERRVLSKYRWFNHRYNDDCDKAMEMPELSLEAENECFHKLYLHSVSALEVNSGIARVTLKSS